MSIASWPHFFPMRLERRCFVPLERYYKIFNMENVREIVKFNIIHEEKGEPREQHYHQNLDFLYVLSGSVDVVIDRIENNNDAGGRGRLTIYTTVVNMIVQSSPLNILFGHGWNQVIVDNPIGLSAHNDFLECIYDFGIIGLFLFLAYVFNMIKYTFHLLKEKSSIGPAMAVAVIIFLVNSSVSHILIYPAFAMQFALFFGYVIGNQEFHSATGSRVIVP